MTPAELYVVWTVGLLSLLDDEPAFDVNWQQFSDDFNELQETVIVRKR